MNNITHYLSVKYSGDWFKIYKAIINGEQISNAKMDSFLNDKAIHLSNTNVLEITDDNYPQSFKILKQPPFALYYSNDLTLFQRKWVWLNDPSCSLENSELFKIHLAGYGFVIYDLQENKQLIYRLIKNNFKVLVVCSKGILYSSCYQYINNNNLWIISEIPPVTTNWEVSQDLKRLCCSLAEFIICVNELNKFDEYLINKVHDLDKQLYLHTTRKLKPKTNFPQQITSVNEIPAFRCHVN